MSALTSEELQQRFAARIPRLVALGVVLVFAGGVWTFLFQTLSWLSALANPFFLAACGPALSLWFATRQGTSAPRPPTGYTLCNDCGAPRLDAPRTIRARQRLHVGGQCRRCHGLSFGIALLVYLTFGLGVLQVLGSILFRQGGL